MFDIDVIIPFVDCDDLIWKEEYKNFIGRPFKFNPVRYRSWGTIKYILRGIEKNMPWVRNIYLIVMSESQVPYYVDPNQVHIIYHKDYIPSQFLPCFNSNPIELFMWNIKGLSEHFIYFNDDMIPLKPILPTDFFTADGTKICCSHSMRYIDSYQAPLSTFINIKKNSTDLAFTAIGKENSEKIILTPRHGIQSYIKSVCVECFNQVKELIYKQLTHLRSRENPNQYLYSNYHLLTHKTDLGTQKTSLKYVDFSKYDIYNIIEFISSPEENVICINDTSAVSIDEFPIYKKEICETLELRFNLKSKYEL